MKTRDYVYIVFFEKLLTFIIKKKTKKKTELNQK